MHGGMAAGTYTWSLAQTPAVFLRNGLGLLYQSWMNDTSVANSKNQLTRQFLDTQATHLMWIDADIAFSAQDIVSMVSADQDIVCGVCPRNAIDWERVAKAVFHTDGIAQVQSITRPLGTPLDHTSIPFQISSGNSASINNLPFQQARAADLLKQVGVIDDTITVLRQQYTLQQQSSEVTHEQSEAFKETVATAQDLRDKIANFDDFFRPLRAYFYWEPHCFDIPLCWSVRSLPRTR